MVAAAIHEPAENAFPAGDGPAHRIVDCGCTELAGDRLCAVRASRGQARCQLQGLCRCRCIGASGHPFGIATAAGGKPEAVSSLVQVDTLFQGVAMKVQVPR